VDWWRCRSARRVKFAEEVQPEISQVHVLWEGGLIMGDT
jgi:hypothetical protein